MTKQKDIAIKVKKIVHYKNNPIDFIEECVKIPTPGGSQLFKLYEPQKRIIDSFFRDNNMILLKSRQIGISTLVQAIIAHICTFYKNCVIGIISRKGDEASDFCRKVQDMIDNLPDWIRPVYKRKATQYFILDNGCQLYTESISPSNPGAPFRGKAIVLLVVDEAAHIKYIDQAWTSVAPALSKSQQTAGEKNIPFGTFIISTPNKTSGIGHWYFDMWVKAEANKNSFKPHKIHWSEISAFANDPLWYKKQCDNLNNDAKKIAQELDLKFIGSDSSLFSDVTQMKLQTIIHKPIETKRGQHSGVFEIFEPIKPHEYHLISVDTASAAGTDNSTIQVMNFTSMNQILEYQGKLEPKLFADEVKLVARMFPNNLIIVENTGGYGLTVLNELQFDEHYQYNIYGEYRGTLSTNKKWIAGLSTNTKSRPLILDALFTYVTDFPDTVKSVKLANELLALTNKTHKLQADAGFNDDLAMAWAFCCYIRRYEPKSIGDVGNKTPEEMEEMRVLSNSISMIRNLNSDNIVQQGYEDLVNEGEYSIADFNKFNKQLYKHITRSVESGSMQGNVNVFGLFNPLSFLDKKNK